MHLHSQLFTSSRLASRGAVAEWLLNAAKPVCLRLTPALWSATHGLLLTDGATSASAGHRCSLSLCLLYLLLGLLVWRHQCTSASVAPPYVRLVRHLSTPQRGVMRVACFQHMVCCCLLDGLAGPCMACVAAPKLARPLASAWQHTPLCARLESQPCSTTLLERSRAVCH